MSELTKIDLNQAQVLQRTREALSQLIDGWDMGYDYEPRDEVRLVASLLDLLFEQSPEGIAHAEEIAKREEEMRLHNEKVDAELAAEDRLENVMGFDDSIELLDNLSIRGDE